MSGYLNICGFETGDNTEALSSFGDNSIQTTTVHSGTYALEIFIAAGGQRGGYVFNGHAADGTKADYSAATAYHRFYFLFKTGVATNDEPIFNSYDANSTNIKFELRLNSAGKLAAYGSGGTTLLATGTTVLSTSTWYRIEVKVGTGNPAAWEVLINGTSEISGSSNVGANNNAQAVFGMDSSRNNNANQDFFYDDIAIRDDQYPGAGQVTYLKPNASGTDAAWTGGTGASDYTQVDETTPDGDTTYIAVTSAGPQKNEVKLTSTSSAGITGVVNCVKALAVVRNASGQVNHMQMNNLSGSTTDTTTAVDPGSTYVLFSKLYTTDFATSSAWSHSGVDNFQPGVNKTEAVAAQQERCTYLSAMVDWTSISFVGEDEISPPRLETSWWW